jgi:hypothetical protein
MKTETLKKEMEKGFLGTVFLNDWYTIKGVQHKKISGEIFIIQNEKIGIRLGGSHANFVVMISGKKIQNVYIQGCKTDMIIAHSKEDEIDSDSYKVL